MLLSPLFCLYYNGLLTVLQIACDSTLFADDAEAHCSYLIELSLQDERLDEVTHFDYLGVRVNNTISWDEHVAKLMQSICPISLCF